MTLENLTDCEQLVMKTVWDSEEELSLMEIMQGQRQVPQRVETSDGIYVPGSSCEKGISETLSSGACVFLSDSYSARGV